MSEKTQKLTQRCILHMFSNCNNSFRAFHIIVILTLLLESGFEVLLSSGNFNIQCGGTIMLL